MTNTQPLHAQLQKLVDAQQVAYEAHLKSKYRLERQFHDKARTILSDLAVFSDSVTFHKPGAVSVEERPEAERALTVQFAEKLISDPDCVVRPIPRSDHVTLYDLSVDRDHKAANYKFIECRRARLDFEKDNADGLKQEIADAEMSKIREALEGNDPEAVRTVLAGKV